MKKISGWVFPVSLGLSVCGFLGGMHWRDQVEAHPKAPASDILAPPDQLLASNEKTRPVADIAPDDYFLSVVQQLDKLYIEEVKDKGTFASGAVRGMITSLGDPQAIFMNPTQMAACEEARFGRFSGVGLELAFHWPQDRPTKEERAKNPYGDVPELVVASVVPGSPADKAGVQIGDRMDSLNGRWLLSTERIKYFRNRSVQIRKTRPWTAAADAQIRALDQQIKRGTSLTKVRDHLMSKTSAALHLTLMRDGKPVTLELTPADTKVEPLIVPPAGPVQLRFFLGAADALAKLDSEGGEIELDLRQSTLGDYDAMKECLKLFGEDVTWGQIVTEKAGTKHVLRTKGETKWKQVKLFVDKTTVGMAALFAQALSMAGKATVTGELTTAKPIVLALNKLPDGSGFTLPIGLFETENKTR